MTLLSVDNLEVKFATHDGDVHAVNKVSFNLQQGDTLGIVGESGSGKSQTVLAAMGLLADNGRVAGSVKFEGRELLGLTQQQLNQIRGDDVSMIFQDPMTSLNPYLKISTQMAEVLQVHKGMSKSAAIAQSVKMLDAVQIPDARGRIHAYPHEFSGGMRQRVMIAMALLCQPKLLIADEPTTALDVTVQKEILQLLDDLQSDLGMAMILITHDLGLVREHCEELIVMYGGQMMEGGTSEAIFAHAKHPYTRGLLSSLPRLDHPSGQPLTVIGGSPPDMLHPPAGCPFAPRCELAEARCHNERPALKMRQQIAHKDQPARAQKHVKACHVLQFDQSVVVADPADAATASHITHTTHAAPTGEEAS